MTTEQQHLYDSLISLTSVTNLGVEKALSHIGTLIDLSSDLNKPEGLCKAIDLSRSLERQALSPAQSTILHYFTGNAWSGLRKIEDKGQANKLWTNAELESEILAFRKALRADGFANLLGERKCQTLTNLGNALDSTGRFIEAIEYWDAALSENQSFAMAVGNRGIGLVHYALALYDPSHQTYCLGHSYRSICDALALPLEEAPKTIFEKYRGWLESNVSSKALTGVQDHEEFLLGSEKEEVRYKNWCLDNRLFLNPLNDLGKDPISAVDVFGLPSIVTGIDEGPYYYGCFNQMKQEFASARYMLFSGAHRNSVHLSDRGVQLYNTLDYPSYGFSAEETKAAFRIAYSLFDKIGYFLNQYLKLGIDANAITFRTFWYAAGKKNRGIREEFQNSGNRSLRGLFWLGKDLYEDRVGFKDAMQPDARELSLIRNHLEHKYLKLHDDLWSGPQTNNDLISSSFVDTLAYSMYRKDFEDRALRLIKMARAGLIYLSLAVHHEERKRRKAKGSDDKVVRQYLDSWEDDWKI